MEKIPEITSEKDALALMLDTFGNNESKSYLPYERQVVAAVKDFLGKRETSNPNLEGE